MGQMGWQESILHWRDSFLALSSDLVAWLDVGPPPELRPCPAPGQIGTGAVARRGVDLIEVVPRGKRPRAAAHAPSR